MLVLAFEPEFKQLDLVGLFANAGFRDLCIDLYCMWEGPGQGYSVLITTLIKTYSTTTDRSLRLIN